MGLGQRGLTQLQARTGFVVVADERQVTLMFSPCDNILIQRMPGQVFGNLAPEDTPTLTLLADAGAIASTWLTSLSDTTVSTEVAIAQARSPARA